MQNNRIVIGGFGVLAGLILVALWITHETGMAAQRQIVSLQNDLATSQVKTRELLAQQRNALLDQVGVIGKALDDKEAVFQKSISDQHEQWDSAMQQQNNVVMDRMTVIDKVFADKEAVLQKSVADQRRELKTAISNMTEGNQLLDKDVNSIVNSGALFPDHSKPAVEAVQLAEKALASGDRKLAEIYYLSAVNHMPSEFATLNKYVETVLADPGATEDDFDKLKSVIQISIYQIPPQSIAPALSLLNQVIGHEQSFLAAQAPKPVPVNWQEKFSAAVKASPLKNSWDDSRKLAAYADDLSGIAQSLREEQSDSALLSEVNNELDRVQRVSAAAQLALTMKTVLKAFNTSPDQFDKAVSVLQTAEALQGQLWGIDFVGFPDSLRSQINAYPKLVQTNVDALAKAKSRPFLEAVIKQRDLTVNYTTVSDSEMGQGSFQKMIDNCERCLKTAIEAAQSISSADMGKEAAIAIQEIRKTEDGARQRQFDAYQKWAVEVCSDAFETFQEDGPSPFSATWKDRFDATDMHEVDETLLSSQTAQLFQDVRQKWMAKITDGATSFYEAKFWSESNKRKLEYF